jgi:hypothetical protein
MAALNLRSPLASLRQMAAHLAAVIAALERIQAKPQGPAEAVSKAVALRAREMAARAKAGRVSKAQETEPTKRGRK